MTSVGAPDAHAVILAGGRGTRFWPLSRRRRPKQLLSLTPEGPLLAQTVARIEPLIPAERQWILTSHDLVDSCADVVPRVPRRQILGEPIGRNTAPAVALAAALLLERVGDVPFTVLPSDHLISPGERFRATLSRALQLAAQQDVLLTFGVRPDRPETGYGYIEAGGPLAGHPQAMAVRAFTEKPDLPTAQRWLAGGRHLWNSGMFAWRASVVLDGLRRHQPGMAEALLSAARAGTPGTDAFAAALEDAYQQVPAISIDYALMERAQNAAVLVADFEWNDVGHWLAMRSLWPADAQGNASFGKTVSVDSGDCIVYGPRRTTALVGVRDLVVVDTDDVLLVCDAQRAQDVRRVIEELERSGDRELL